MGVGVGAARLSGSTAVTPSRRVSLRSSKPHLNQFSLPTTVGKPPVAAPLRAAQAPTTQRSPWQTSGSPTSKARRGPGATGPERPWAAGARRSRPPRLDSPRRQPADHRLDRHRALDSGQSAQAHRSARQGSSPRTAISRIALPPSMWPASRPNSPPRASASPPSSPSARRTGRPAKPAALPCRVPAVTPRARRCPRSRTRPAPAAAPASRMANPDERAARSRAGASQSPAAAPLPCQRDPDRWFDRADRTDALATMPGLPRAQLVRAAGAARRASWGMWAGIWIDGRLADVAHYLQAIAAGTPAPPRAGRTRPRPLPRGRRPPAAQPPPTPLPGPLPRPLEPPPIDRRCARR